jgi:hypothetical protein
MNYFTGLIFLYFYLLPPDELEDDLPEEEELEEELEE